MRQARVFRILLWILVACSGVLLALYYLMLSAWYGSFFWFGYLFPEEPRVKEVAQLSSGSPTVFLSDLLDESWDYVCVVTPYYPVELDPKLAGVQVPWIDSDGAYAIVLVRGPEHDVIKIDRGDVVYFQPEGLAETAACYDDTNVVFEYVEGESPVTVRVRPGD